MTNLIETIQDTEKGAQNIIQSAHKEAERIVAEAKDKQRADIADHKTKLIENNKTQLSEIKSDLQEQAKKKVLSADATIQKLTSEADGNMKQAIDFIVNHITQS